jgi:hypothetical protein
MQSFWSVIAYSLMLMAPCLVAITNFTIGGDPRQAR